MSFTFAAPHVLPQCRSAQCMPDDASQAACMLTAGLHLGRCCCHRRWACLRTLKAILLHSQGSLLRWTPCPAPLSLPLTSAPALLSCWRCRSLHAMRILLQPGLMLEALVHRKSCKLSIHRHAFHAGASQGQPAHASSARSASHAPPGACIRACSAWSPQPAGLCGRQGR